MVLSGTIFSIFEENPARSQLQCMEGEAQINHRSIHSQEDVTDDSSYEGHLRKLRHKIEKAIQEGI